MRSLVATSLTVVLVIATAACSSPAATSGPGGPGSTNAPVATAGAAATTPVLAGDPCSYLTLEEVGVLVGATPISAEERAGRGDCDYFFSAAKDAKVNVGLFELADGGDATFESTKAFGDPVSFSLGDEAYTVYNESLGALVLAKAGDIVIVVQAFNTGDRAAMTEQAMKLADALYNKI
jgi:hypothetical protein